MNSCETQYRPPASSPSDAAWTEAAGSLSPQTALLEAFFPGFSVLSTGLYRYTQIDLSIYFPMLLALGVILLASRYLGTWAWELLETHAMSTADVRVDDEMYNMLMGWVANQKFSQRARRFVANTNLSSRTWFLMYDLAEEREEEKEDETNIEFDTDSNPVAKIGGKKEKKVRFTPSFGTHYFRYKGHLLIFRRNKDPRQAAWGPVSEREEISISSFGRNPTILKTLLDECRAEFMKSDENRTVIYRGTAKAGTHEPQWTRCISRVSRPFSTVVLDEHVKKNLLDDMKDYLHPYTRRWYANRGIPYRRGYLLSGPPGTGKSSLSLAIAGYFKLKIYIVSLNSPSMDEETLGTLFSELPKQCVVLLEDIDTAGLTHTRDTNKDADNPPVVAGPPGSSTGISEALKARPGRISLSALLNILDGVASQEGRVLIMTTNHIEKLDEALIRPGRVDMTVKFDLASTEMISTIFRYIFATLEGDFPSSKSTTLIRTPKIRGSNESEKKLLDDKIREEEEEKAEQEFLAKKKREEEKVEKLGEEFSKIIPTMTFSPAEVQGYLLKHKREPEKAVSGVREWVREMRTKKRKEAEKARKEEEARLKAEKEEEEKEAKEKEAEEREEKEAKEKEAEEREEKEAKEKKEKEEDGSKRKCQDKKALVNGAEGD